MADQNDLALIDEQDLSLVKENSLNASQLQQILKRTPAQYVKQRPAKGGGTWDYVTGGYVKKCLNLMFGWDWDFEILEQLILHGECVVKGKLTCRTNGRTIVKTQFGNKEIICKAEKVFNQDGTAKMITKNNRTYQETKPGTIPLSIGNDLKAAATDCLKKCAAEIGVAADIYNKDDFREVKIDTKIISLEELEELFELKKDFLNPADIERIEEVIAKKETRSYKKIISELAKL